VSCPVCGNKIDPDETCMIRFVDKKPVNEPSPYGETVPNPVTGDNIIWHQQCYSAVVQSGRIVELLKEAGKLRKDVEVKLLCCNCGKLLSDKPEENGSDPKGRLYHRACLPDLCCTGCGSSFHCKPPQTQLEWDRLGLKGSIIVDSPNKVWHHECYLKALGDAGAKDAAMVGAAPAPTSARARARAIEEELKELARREQENAKRKRELEEQKAEADKQARQEEHEENARGWAAALWLCLSGGKADCVCAAYLPPGPREGQGTTEYEFRLFSGETVWLKVKHAPGARPPKAAKDL